MTQVIEEITIKVTLNHCAVDSSLYYGEVNLLDTLSRLWPSAIWNAVRTTIRARDDKQFRINPHKGIDVCVVATGLFEAPELGGGDN